MILIKFLKSCISDFQHSYTLLRLLFLAKQLKKKRNKMSDKLIVTVNISRLRVSVNRT